MSPIGRAGSSPVRLIESTFEIEVLFCFEFYRGHCVKDHVHMVVSFHPTRNKKIIEEINFARTISLKVLLLLLEKGIKLVLLVLLRSLISLVTIVK